MGLFEHRSRLPKGGTFALAALLGLAQVAQAVPVTVQLKDSNGTGLGGAEVRLYDVGWKLLGATGSSGNVTQDIPAGTYTFRISYLGAYLEKAQDIRTYPTVTFKTVRVTIQLEDSRGRALTGGATRYYANGWRQFGNTDSTGQVSRELLPLPCNFSMAYLGGYQERIQDTGTDPTVMFKTARAVVELRDSDGVGLKGGAVKYYADGWKTFGTTDSTGKANRELLPALYRFGMTYLGGLQEKKYDVGVDSTLTFQTAKTVVRLMDCESNGIYGGSVRYNADGWKAFGATGPDGQVSKELLPITYDFGVSYLGRYEEKNQFAGVPIEFTTTKVSILFSGDMEYYSGGWQTFTKPSMEMLPGTYRLRFDHLYEWTINVIGCVVEQTIVFIRLIDSKGNGLVGGSAEFYDKTWYPVHGLTDLNGLAVQVFDGLKTDNMDFRMTYGYVAEEKRHNLGTYTTLTFQTANVAVQLRNSFGALMDGGMVEYFADGWRSFGFTFRGEVSREMLPSNYNFRMTYAYASNDQTQSIRANPTIVFQTGRVISNSGTCINYFSNGWHPFIQGMELLPNQYTFQFSDGAPEMQYVVLPGTANYIH
jgi:hypothetical protein